MIIISEKELVMKISITTLLVAGVWCLLSGTAGTVLGVCPECPAGEEEKAPDSLQLAHADKETERLKKCLKDTTLDNPEDSTTGRHECIDRLFLGANPPELDAYNRNHWYPIFADLLKNDPYPKMRTRVMNYLSGRWIPKSDRYVILTAALNDPHWYVRTYAACLILRKCSYDSIIPDPRVHEMVKNTALGIGRSQWNVKGFYSVKESENEADAVEHAKDMIQNFATSCLDVYILTKSDKNRNVLEYLDSLENHGTTENIRSAAKKSKKIYRNDKNILR